MSSSNAPFQRHTDLERDATVARQGHLVAAAEGLPSDTEVKGIASTQAADVAYALGPV